MFKQHRLYYRMISVIMTSWVILPRVAVGVRWGGNIMVVTLSHDTCAQMHVRKRTVKPMCRCTIR